MKSIKYEKHGTKQNAKAYLFIVGGQKTRNQEWCVV